MYLLHISFLRHVMITSEAFESDRKLYNLAKRYLDKANNTLSTFKQDKRRYRIYFLKLYPHVEFIFLIILLTSSLAGCSCKVTNANIKSVKDLRNFAALQYNTKSNMII